MRIDEHLLKVIPQLKPYSKQHFDGLPDEAKRFCETNGVPVELRDCLTNYNLAATLGDFFGLPDGFLEMNDLAGDEFNPIQEGLFVVGASISGDPLAIDLQTGAIGFISHDELYQVQKVREVFCPVAPSLGEFCQRGLVDQTLPRDYYEALGQKETTQDG